MRNSRSASTGLPVTAAAARKASNSRAVSGVNTFVSTGAMFSITDCFASTSHAATITAPAAALGSNHVITTSPASRPIELNAPIVSATSTPPPNAMSA